MSLAEGQRLGPYEVLGRIGAGGMGEVYRARDTRLDRTVALKVLPSEVSGDGIVHRDLKPGNVMLTKTGAKLLDFGLAGLTDHGERPAVGLASTPTEAAPSPARERSSGRCPTWRRSSSKASPRTRGQTSGPSAC